jgi:hypothetical protein
MSTSDLIVLEFNELVPRLMEKFMAEGQLPNFRRLHDEAEVHITNADEDYPNLEPWIQWITVHSGVPFREHNVHDLGDGHKLAAKNIWDVVSEAGDKVWVCGSMNVTYQKPLQGWVLPDPWMVQTAPQPAELEPFYKFVSAHVTDYTSGKTRLTPADYARFVAFMARHGLSLDTVKAIAMQLGTERLDGSVGWKRATLQDRLQFDLFSAVYKRIKPRLSTFFLNSTAHFQHIYWRDMEPEHFTIQPDPKHRAAHASSILYGYQSMDRLVGQFLELAGPNTTVVFCTALSQQPCTMHDDTGGKTFYRPRDFAEFLQAVGVQSFVKVAPVMAQQFHVDFANEHEAEEAQGKLATLKMEVRGEIVDVMNIERKGASVFGGCRIKHQVAPGDVVRFEGSDRTLPFLELFYSVDILKSGMHHRDGILWIRRPDRRHAINPEKVPLVSVAPTLLQLLGLDPPASMKAPPIEVPQRRVA